MGKSGRKKGRGNLRGGGRISVNALNTEGIVREGFKGG